MLSTRRLSGIIFGFVAIITAAGFLYFVSKVSSTTPKKKKSKSNEIIKKPHDDKARPTETINDEDEQSKETNNLNETKLEENNCSLTSVDETDDSILPGGSNRLLTTEEARSLCLKLSKADVVTQKKVLATISNAAAFTHNQDTLREVGCLRRLSGLLRIQSVTIGINPLMVDQELCSSLAIATSNLAINPSNMLALQESVEILGDLSCHKLSGDELRVNCLKALTNLSVINPSTAFIPLIPRFFKLTELGEYVTLHALRVLVNLSASDHLVSPLLAAQVPLSLSSISPDTDEKVLLRWLTLLRNIVATVDKLNLTISPCGDPTGTLHQLLQSRNLEFSKRIEMLCKNDNPDIESLASTVQAALS